MERHEVNQRLLALFDRPAYLEIGVDAGTTFHATQAASKVGVDPTWRFDIAAAKADPANRNCRYENVPSDTFFTAVKAPVETFDYAFIDGLHTFEQTLRDMLHVMACLRPGGVVVVDDVIPSRHAASLPDLELSRRLWALDNVPGSDWMGDVFRLAFFVRDYMTAWSYATVEENHGQMVMWQQARPAPSRPRSVEAIARLGYVDTVLERDAFNILPLDTIVQQVRAWKASLSS